MDTTLDAILVVDERGSIESANPAVERILGYSVAEVVGRPLQTLLAPSGPLTDWLPGGPSAGREAIGQRRDGATFPLDVTVGEVPLPDERLFVAIARDASERKRAGAERDEALAAQHAANAQLE